MRDGRRSGCGNRVCGGRQNRGRRVVCRAGLGDALLEAAGLLGAGALLAGSNFSSFAKGDCELDANNSSRSGKSIALPIVSRRQRRRGGFGGSLLCAEAFIKLRQRALRVGAIRVRGEERAHPSTDATRLATMYSSSSSSMVASVTGCEGSTWVCGPAAARVPE